MQCDVSRMVHLKVNLSSNLDSDLLINHMVISEPLSTSLPSCKNKLVLLITSLKNYMD